MFETITSGWNFFRAARLLVGIAALVQAILLREWLLAAAGALVAGLALANMGCSSGSCGVPASRHTSNNLEKEISYEELDHTK